MINILYDKVQEFKLCILPPKVLNNPKKYNLGHIEEIINHVNLSYDSGKFYFCKNPGYPVYLKGLLNELIGMYYARLLDIDTVEYTIKRRCNRDFYRNNVYLLSENFWNSNHLDVKNLIVPNDQVGINENNSNQKLRVVDLSRIASDLLIEDIIKMTSIHLVMRQDDSNMTNFCFRRENGVIRLGKLFDYEHAYFMGPENYSGPLMYSNPFLDVEISKDGFKELIDMFPIAYSIFKALIDIEYRFILNEIEKNYPIQIDDNYKDELASKDEEIRKIMKKVL